jgi:hypothetical protein
MHLTIRFLISLVLVILFATEVTKLQASSTNSIEPISNVSIGNNGTILVNDKPFFPIGLYHDSQASPDWHTQGVKRLNDLKNIAEAGFNIIHPEIGGNDESDMSFLKEALKLGVYVLPNFSYDNQTATISKYKDNPAILGWDIADDVDHPDNKFTQSSILRRHEEVKNIDSNRLTYISGAFLNRIEAFIHSADLVGFQSYPVDNNPEDKSPLRSSYYIYKTLISEKLSGDSKHTVIANLQAFPWKDIPPTFRDVRNMTYSALINGVKGIIYYTYFSDSWELSQNTKLWEGMKSIAHEIKEFSNVLLEGKLTNIDTQIDNLYVGQWVHKNNIYLVVVNTFPELKSQASINIPIQGEWSMKSLFPGQPSGMNFRNGRLQGIIESGDVHVYQLSKLNK